MNLNQTDKIFWHGYIDFYNKFFQNRHFNTIAEIGIWKGASINWLLERFDNSIIHAADILPIQPEWPNSDRVIYHKIDQGNIEEVKNFFSISKFDLIIEDGSHDPVHQVNCLKEGLNSLNEKGIYILEDIHTSLGYNVGNALTVLLAIDHFLRLDKDINFHDASKISQNSLLSTEDVLNLSNVIKNISLYKRTHLPNFCYNCKSVEFNYSKLKCVCGIDLFSFKDSMSAVIEKK